MGRCFCLAPLALVLSACASGSGITGPSGAPPSPSYIFAWSADADGADSDFLAVIDATPNSATYGKIVNSLAVGMRQTNAHHTEPEMSETGFLLANGFDAGTTFSFDLRLPRQPRLAAPLAVPKPFEHAHSFLRLADGRVLATYQYQGADHALPGGIVEYDQTGTVLKTGSAVDRSSSEFVRPYSLAASPAIDRVITSGNDMHDGPSSQAVQIWRLSTLSLLSTITLPAGPRGDENVNSYEPRFLPDGRTAFVSTRSCGLYRLVALESHAPSARLVHTFDDSVCFVPVVIGNYWLQPLRNKPEIVVLDITDPDAPREISRTRLKAGDSPHWLSASEDGARVLITGFEGLKHRLLVAEFNRGTGTLTVDETFGDGGLEGVSFDRSHWPHGTTGAAIPHGSVFSRRAKTP